MFDRMIKRKKKDVFLLKRSIESRPLKALHLFRIELSGRLNEFFFFSFAETQNDRLFIFSLFLVYRVPPELKIISNDYLQLIFINRDVRETKPERSVLFYFNILFVNAIKCILQPLIPVTSLFVESVIGWTAFLDLRR